MLFGMGASVFFSLQGLAKVIVTIMEFNFSYLAIWGRVASKTEHDFI